MKNLKNYGVQELNAKEMTQTDGGGPISDFVHWLTHVDWSWSKGWSSYRRW